MRQEILKDPPRVLQVKPGILLLYINSAVIASGRAYEEKHPKSAPERREQQIPVLILNDKIFPQPYESGHLFFTVHGKLHLATVTTGTHYASRIYRNVYDLSDGTLRRVYDEHETISVRPATRPSKKISQEDAENPQDSAGMGLALLKGKVLSSSPKELRLQVSGETTQEVLIRVSLKTKFVPFRRPRLGETVEVGYRDENGSKFGHLVKIIE